MGFFLLSSAATTTTSVAAPVVPSYLATLTAYNAVPEQTDGNPFETASGAYSNPEVVAARSQDLAARLPFGTIIELDAPADPQNNCGFGVVESRIGYRVVADTMNKRYTDRLDVLFHNDSSYKSFNGMKNAAQVLGICKGVTYRVVGFVKIGQIPKTQAELAKLVNPQPVSGDLAIK
jgi:3D (Asp-Asp-Asp) domain-containing protein